MLNKSMPLAIATKRHNPVPSLLFLLYSFASSFHHCFMSYTMGIIMLYSRTFHLFRHVIRSVDFDSSTLHKGLYS